MISIKTAEEIELMRTSGKIAYNLLKYLETKIEVGVTTEYLDKLAYDFIISHDATPSFLNYEGFPASICTSINEEVVHGIPSKRKLKNKEIIKLDVGVCYKGYHSDTASTFKVGHVSKQVEEMMNNTKKALYSGIKEIKPGVKLNKVCESIEQVAIKSNLGVIRELTGHGVGTTIHEEPYIPNYKNNESELLLEEGMTLAIEPMLTLGDREVCILEDGWTIVTEDESLSAHYEHTVLVTKDGYEILTGE